MVLSASVVVFGLTYTAVTTSSMSPTYEGYQKTNTTTDIFNGDLVILQKKTPQVGDVDLFRPINENNLYLHRIIAISTTESGIFYITKGDNNRYTDNNQLGNTVFGWIPESNVVGVAVFTIHWVGWFVNEIVSINFLIGLIALITLLIICYMVLKDELVRYLKNLRNKKNFNFFINFKGKKIHLSLMHLKRLLMILSVLIILVIPISMEIFNAGFHTVDVQLLQTDDTILPNYIDLSKNHLYFSNMEEIQYNGKSFDFLNIKLKITSGGLFNSVENVKIQVQKLNSTINQDSDPYYYEWTTTYFFAGTKVVNGLLVIPTSFYTGLGNTTLQIQIDYSVSHIFFHDTNSKQQLLTLS